MASPTVEAVARSGELVYHVTIVSEGNAPRRLFFCEILVLLFIYRPRLVRVIDLVVCARVE